MTLDTAATARIIPDLTISFFTTPPRSCRPVHLKMIPDEIQRLFNFGKVEGGLSHMLHRRGGLNRCFRAGSGCNNYLPSCGGWPLADCRAGKPADCAGLRRN